MKRNLLALAVAAASVMPLVAQAAPTVYGRLNLSIDYVDVNDDNAPGVDNKSWNVNSNASRVGVKGNEKLTDDFTAVYKAEWEVSGDTQGLTDLKGRERYIGLKHSNLGTLRLGGIDSPFKTSEDDVDVFNDLVGLDMNHVLSGQTRLDNSINYVSPKILDVFGANITFQPGEQSKSAGATVNEDHLADAISAALSYEDDSLYLSVAMDKDVNVDNPALAVKFGAPATDKHDAWRVVGRYKMNDFEVAGLYQTGKLNTNVAGAKLDENALVVSASYAMDKVTVKGEFASSKFDAGLGLDAKIDLLGVGVDYGFSQTTKVFANLAQLKGSPSAATGMKDSTSMQLGGGIEVRF